MGGSVAGHAFRHEIKPIKFNAELQRDIMRVSFVALTLFILCAASAFAQQTSRPGSVGRVEQPSNNRVYGQPGEYNGRRIDPNTADNNRNWGVSSGMSTFLFSAEVINVHPENQQIEIRRKSNKTEHTLTVAPNCKIKADEKEFGKKELKLEEIEPGYRVEVLIELSNNLITQMRVKKPKA